MATIKSEESVPADLGSMLDAGDGAVVTLVAGQTQLAAHRAVLQARSPVFAAMLQHDMLESNTCQVSIPDVEGPVLRQLVSYLYTLQAPQLPAVAPQLLSAADKYGVSGLKAHCEQQLVAQLDVENAAAVAVLAVRHCCPSLTEAAVAFIRDNSQVMATQGWADAVRTQPEHVVQVSRLLADPPEDSSAPASKRTRLDPSAQRRQQQHQQPPTTASAAAAAHRTAPHGAYDVSRLRRLSGDGRGKKLIHAATQGAVEELRALMALGVNVDALDMDLRTALHWAASEGHVEAARCLLDGGASVNATSRGGDTPLHVAVASGNTAVVRLLLAAGAQCNPTNSWGRTPLHWAAWSGDAEAAAALLEAGASTRFADSARRTALDYARQNDQQLLVEMLTPHQHTQ